MEKNMETTLGVGSERLEMDTTLYKLLYYSDLYKFI